MKYSTHIAVALALVGAVVILSAAKTDGSTILTGKAAFLDSVNLKPGTFRKINAAELDKPFATRSASNFARVVKRPANAWPQAPAGFNVALYVDSGLQSPRQIRTAPNG